MITEIRADIDRFFAGNDPEAAKCGLLEIAEHAGRYAAVIEASAAFDEDDVDYVDYVFVDEDDFDDDDDYDFDDDFEDDDFEDEDEDDDFEDEDDFDDEDE